jgi:sulfonate transport system ATP-binding protein
MCDDLAVRALLEQGLSPYDPGPLPSPAELGPGGVAISVAGLTKSFGTNRVLRGIDLDVRAGEFLTIIGKSGCGKSTLLRILAGLDRPMTGRVLFDGKSREDSGAVARLMFQEPRLLPWSRVLGNVEVGLGSRRTAPDAGRRALSKLAAVGLQSRAHDWPSVLSGGQKQRVALARALASSPHFLAFDEPLGALDALTRIDMQGLIERVWREQGFSAVLVTHDVTEAIVLGDRVVLIDDGAIKLELAVDLPRPRRRTSPAVAALEERLLGCLFDNPQAERRRAVA